MLIYLQRILCSFLIVVISISETGETAYNEKNILPLISRQVDGQLNSIDKDIRKRRRTKIDSFNLEIARLADETGQPDLVTHTKLLGEMIRLKSQIKLV